MDRKVYKDGKVTMEHWDGIERRAKKVAEPSIDREMGSFTTALEGLEKMMNFRFDSIESKLDEQAKKLEAEVKRIDQETVLTKAITLDRDQQNYGELDKKIRNLDVEHSQRLNAVESWVRSHDERIGQAKGGVGARILWKLLDVLVGAVGVGIVGVIGFAMIQYIQTL